METLEKSKEEGSHYASIPEWSFIFKILNIVFFPDLMRYYDI